MKKRKGKTERTGIKEKRKRRRKRNSGVGPSPSLLINNVGGTHFYFAAPNLGLRGFPSGATSE